MKALKTALIAILTSAATVIVTNLITGQPLSGLVKLKGLSETFLRSSVPAWAFFRLEAEIKLVRGGAKDGKYLEVWQSPARWRRELTIGEYHYIQVSDPNDDKHSWVVEPSEMAGFGRKTLGFLQLNELDANSWKVGKVFDRDNHGVQLTCIEAKESVGEKRTICFDRVTKGLQSVRYSSLLSHWQHEYSQYIAFGGFNFPGRIKSESSDDGSLEIVVTELAPESGSDTTIFAKAPNSAGVPRRHSTATPLSMLAISCIALRTSTPRTILRIRVPMIVRTRSISHNSSQQIGLCPKSPMKNKFERSKVRSRFRYG